MRRAQQAARPRAPSTSVCSARSRSRSSAGGVAPHQAVDDLQVLAAAELAAISRRAGRWRRRCLGTPRQHARRVLDQPDDADDRRRIDRLAVGLVVEADVAAGDRDVQRAARVGHAFDRLDELPHDLGPLGVAEVQAVGRADRDAAGAGDVARRLGDRQHRAAPRIEVAVAAVAVGRRSPARGRVPFTRTTPALIPGHARSCSVRTIVVVLPVDPALAGDGRRRQQRAATRPAAASGGSDARDPALATSSM